MSCNEQSLRAASSCRRALPPDSDRWHSGYLDAAAEEMPVAGMTIGQALQRRVQERGASTFLVFESADEQVSELSYAEFAAHVQRLAVGMEAAGVARGDRILMQLPNRTEVVAAMFAAARIGAIIAPSNTANRMSEFAYLLEVTDARLILTVADHLPTVHGALAETGRDAPVVVCGSDGGQASGAEIAYDALLENAGEVSAASPLPSDPLEILFSSGTTSRPKGVVATHTNLLTSGRRQAMSYRADSADRFLTVLPLFHASAQSTTLFAALAAGATAIFLERYSASRFWSQVRRHRASRLTLVTMLLRTLNAQPPRASDRDHLLRSVGFATNMAEDAQRAFEERFDVRLTNAYGLTEALTEVTIAPVDGARHWPSVGVPTMDRAVRIVGEDGSELAPGEQGEIQIQGVPGVTIMKEYYRDQEATEWALNGGWLRTHDVGWVDEDGYLFFSDRDLDLIKCAGENVSATEVEAVLIQHPQIMEAAVVGIPDPVRDEAIKAFIVPADGADPTEREIRDFCRARMAGFKVPSVIAFTRSLPANSVGKIEKKRLQQVT